jgi:uncharacterized membrane protein YfcA
VPLALWMLAGSAPLSLVGVQIASSFSGTTTDTMGRIVGATLILGGFGFLAKTFVSGVQEDRPFHMSTRDKVIAVVIGATFGFVVGLTSVGSGTFFGLAMLLVYPLTARRIVGTDMLHAALLLWVAGFGHLVQGNVDLHAMAWLLLGSVPGIWASSRFTVHLPQDALRLGLAGVLALSGIKLLNVPEASYVIAVGVGLGLSAFAVWLLLQSRSREAERPDDSRAAVADGDGDGFRGDAALEARAEPDLADARR